MKAGGSVFEWRTHGYDLREGETGVDVGVSDRDLVNHYVEGSQTSTRDVTNDAQIEAPEKRKLILMKIANAMSVML